MQVTVEREGRLDMDISEIMNDIGKINKKNIQINVSEDNQSVRIILKSPGEDEQDYTLGEVNEAISEIGVKMGLNTELVTKMVDDKIYDVSTVIAIGKVKEEGIDGYFEYMFDTKIDGKPIIREDGSADYYNARKFETVNKDDVVARYHPPTNGTFGYDVKGRLLIPKQGKKIMSLRGRGFTVSEDGLIYFASKTGKIEYRNGEINITDIYEINGDLDLNIGNVDFNGDVQINGNVISGLVINAKGNIYIGGYVEGAFIKSEKDIVLKNGVNAKGFGSIEAKGNVFGRFFENVKIMAGGDVRANYIYNSDVIAYGKVIAEGKKATIVSGDVTGVMGVKTGICGNGSYVMTDIRLGPTKFLNSDYANIIMKLKDINSQLEIFENALKKMPKEIQVMTSDRKTMYTKIFQAKVIKSAEKAKCEEERKKLFDIIRESNGASLIARNVLYPGTRIFIQSHMYEPNTKFSHALVRLYNNEIIVRDSEEE